MALASEPGALECAECGEAIDGQGYLPATDGGDELAPVADAAVCGTCGFNEIGMMGCAPELEELDGAERAGTLLYVDASGDELEVLSEK